MSNTRGFDYTVAVSADLVILTIREGVLQAVVVKRGTAPFKGRLALPGGFIRSGESLEDTVIRKLDDETGLDGRSLPLEQVGTYSGPHRDPRGHVVTTAFLAIAPDLPMPKPYERANVSVAQWKPVSEVLQDGALAFDHVRILADAVEQARRKLQYTTIATAFCAEEFTIGELRTVYEIVWGVNLDRANFRRKVKDASEFIVPTGQTRMNAEGRLGRPAELYRAGEGAELASPILLGAHVRRANGGRV